MSKKEVPFKELLGERIVIALPKLSETTEGGIILTPEAQKKQQMDDIDKTQRIEVVMVGTDSKYKDRLKQGDHVFIQQRALQPGIAEPIIIKGEAKWLIIPDREVVGIY